MANLSDIAKRAGVSITTASFVINGRAQSMRIAPQTVAKVIEAVRELGYIPNVSAKKLTDASAAGSKPEIALMWAPKVGSAFLEAFVAHTQDMIERNDIQEIRLTINPFRLSRMDRLSEDFLARNYNGAVVSPYFNEEFQYIQRIAARIPLVVLHIQTDAYSNVIVDNYYAGRQAADIFARRGHRNVAMLYFQRLGASTARVDHRISGFRDACEEAGLMFETIPVPQNNTRALTVAELSAFGRERARHYLEYGNLPEAIFVQNDVVAMGFMTTLQAAGVRTPQDIEIITYGDDRVAAACWPGITTIDYPSYAITKNALRILEERLRDPFLPPECVAIKTGVTFRDSCPMPEGWPVLPEST